MNVPKHLCPACGRFIKWALLFCFDCNARIPRLTLPQTADNQVMYPVAQDGAASLAHYNTRGESE